MEPETVHQADTLLGCGWHFLFHNVSNLVHFEMSEIVCDVHNYIVYNTWHDLNIEEVFYMITQKLIYIQICFQFWEKLNMNYFLLRTVIYGN